MKISVVGLGKLGAPLVAVLASKGYEVIGIDTNHRCVQQINQGMAPVNEQGLQELIEKHTGRIKATQDYTTAVLNTDVTFIVVPTPSQSDHLFSNSCLYQALEKVGIALQQKASYHLVVVMSTVIPGSMGGELQRVLERYTQRSIGEWLGFCYNPEFIALGSVIQNMLRPDLILIGESDAKAGDYLEAIYRCICENTPPICRMNLINAELTKLAVNTFVTAKISYANMISDLCDYLPGADVDVVTATLGLDSRIGPKYLKGAVAFGGPCFPRDNLALSALAQKLGARADIAIATQKINEHQSLRIQNFVEMHAMTRRIGVLGLAYKPGTKIVESSQGIHIANQLALQGYQVTAYDPSVLTEVQGSLMRDIEVVESIEACFEASDLLVIMTPWPQFAEMITRDYLEGMPKKIIIDCWRLLPVEELEEVCDLIHLGAGKLSALCEMYE